MGGRGHLDLPDLELPVEVGKLAARVFQKKLSLQQEDGTEYIKKQDGGRGANPVSIGMKQDSFVRGHELQLAHEPEAIGEKKSDGDEECIGNHLFLQVSRVLKIRFRRRSGRKSTAAEVLLTRAVGVEAKDGGMDCGDCEEEGLRVNTEVARGGSAEAARRTLATPFSLPVRFHLNAWSSRK